MFAVPQLSSPQNNPYAKVTYFGVEYSEPLQYQRICGHILKLPHFSSAARQPSRLSSCISGISLSMSICGFLYNSCSLNAGLLRHYVLLIPHVCSRPPYIPAYHFWADNSPTQGLAYTLRKGHLTLWSKQSLLQIFNSAAVV